mgnify:FL=1
MVLTRAAQIWLVGMLLAMAAMAWPAWAKVSGPCVNCHTMHNSQAGSPMAYTVSSGETTYTSTPNKGLLNTDCVGCHQGSNSGGPVPYVLDVSQPTYGATGTEGDTLAGGNFYWVSQGNDRAGHNVAGLAAADLAHGNLPPGSTDSAPLSQLTCAGTYGCHGAATEIDATVALLGSHHANDMTAWNDGSTVAKSYRFLDGVRGLEDSDYEYRPTSSAHNKYYGVDRTGETESSGTISNHCGRCHDDFHHGTGEISEGVFSNNVWLRHPTDFDMSNAAGSEYGSYNDYQEVGNPYSVISPVATADTSTTLNTTVYSQADDAIVMCLSCHRAHGSPYDGILRWDYKNWPGTGFNGCAICHTAKD